VVDVLARYAVAGLRRHLPFASAKWSVRTHDRVVDVPPKLGNGCGEVGLGVGTSHQQSCQRAIAEGGFLHGQKTVPPTL
jgi:hypothetical protein